MAEDSVAQDQLRAFVERIERMEDEKSAISDDIKEIYAEAKGNGFDTKTLRKLVKIRKQDANERMEQEALLELYMSALGMVGAPVEDEYDPEQERLAAIRANLRANAALAIVSAPSIKKPQTQPALQAGSDLTTPAALNGQVASNPVAKAADDANSGDATSEVSAVADAPEQAEVASRGAGDRAPAATSEDMDATAGETAPSSGSGKSVVVPASAAPAAIYAAPGVITWEVAPPEGVQRHDFSAAFGDLGQDLVVIGDEIASARAEPIVKIGNVILDGWARYMVARGAIGLDGHSTEYSVVQYDGADPLMDCIKWNLAGRILNETQKRLIAQRLAKLQPKRKNDIYAAMDMGMELVA